MASLLALTLLPLNVAAAEEVAEAEQVKEAKEVAEAENPTEVLPSDYEEGNLDYLTLVDSFVTAERIPTSRFDTPANVTVITAEEIEANHYKSVGEILDHVPGVFAGGSFINGSDRRVVLIDGVRREFFPPINMIERIEIVKGGGSALYGTDAVGGVINIITKKGLTNQTTLDFSFGSWKTRNYEFSNEGIEGKFNWFASGNFKSHKVTDIAGGIAQSLYDQVNDSDNSHFAFNLGYDFDERNSLGMSLSFISNSFGNYLPTYRGKEKAHEIALVYDFKKGTSTPGFFRYYNIRQESNYDNNLISDNSRIIYGGDHRQRIQNIQYQNGWEFGKHKLIAGLEYYKINRNSWYWNYDEKEVKNTAYYLQDTISPDDKWTIVPGVRLDHNNEFGNKWSPKLAVNYRADEKTKIFASWGSVYRAPSMEELYANVVHTVPVGNVRYISFRHFGSPDLKPERGHTETIGIEHNFDDNTNIRASIFNTNMKDYITMSGDIVYSSWGYYYDEDYDDYYNATFYDSSTTKKHRGFEVDFQQKINDHFQYNLGYAFLKTKANTNNLGYFSGSIPKNSIYLGLHYADGPFKANLYGRFGSGEAEKGFKNDNYFILDVNASYDVADWATIYLAGTNLTDKNYATGALHSSGRGFLAGALFKF